MDLLGVSDEGRLVVVELKVKPESSKDRGDDPMTALMEGLRYSAIIGRNRGVIAREVRYCWDIEVADRLPIVQILAPKAWWQGWFELKSATRRRTGDWEREFEKLIGDIERQLDIAVECVALDDICRADICYGPDGVEPHIAHAPALYPVRPGEGVIGPALCPHRPGG